MSRQKWKGYNTIEQLVPQFSALQEFLMLSDPIATLYSSAIWAMIDQTMVIKKDKGKKHDRRNK